MEVENIKQAISAYEVSKFENILQLCDSYLEKKFLGYLYHFFKVNEFHPRYEMISPGDIDNWNDTKLSAIWKYINSHPYKSHNYNWIRNAEINEKHILCGFSVKCYDVIYRFFPQFPIYDTSKIRFADFVVEVRSLDYKVLKDFIIECDGYSFHSTRSQIENDNERTLFLSAHGYTVLRLSSLKIKNINEEVIINLENLFYHSIFKKKSNLFNMKTM